MDPLCGSHWSTPVSRLGVKCLYLWCHLMGPFFHDFDQYMTHKLSKIIMLIPGILSMLVFLLITQRLIIEFLFFGKCFSSPPSPQADLGIHTVHVTISHWRY